MAALVLSLAMTTTGCTETNNVIKVAAQSPITPIVLKIVHGGLVTIAEDVPSPQAKAVALVGVFAVDTLSSAVASEQNNEKAMAEDAVLLLVTQTIRGQVQTSVFKITTSHKLIVAMNGKFIETLEPKKITITAEPGTDSTIVVTDAQAGQITYINAKINLAPSNFANNMLGDHSHTDLDTGRDKNLPDPNQNADLFDSGTGGVVTVNGAKAARWTSSDAPTLAGCESLPKAAWTTKLYGSFQNLGGPGGDVWCVLSKQGRYGTLASGGNNANYAWTFGYVLWKKPGDN